MQRRNFVAKSAQFSATRRKTVQSGEFLQKEDVNARQPEIKKKRVTFAKRHLRSRGRLSNTLANATTLGHRWMHLHSQNKQHSLQFHLPGSAKPLRPLLKSTNNPKVHVMFAANANGTELFFRAKTRPLERGKDKGKLIVENINVDGKKLRVRFVKSLESSCMTQNVQLHSWTQFVLFPALLFGRSSIGKDCDVYPRLEKVTVSKVDLHWCHTAHRFSTETSLRHCKLRHLA